MPSNGKSRQSEFDRGYELGKAIGATDERLAIVKWLRTRRALNLMWRMLGPASANSETADLIEAGRHTMVNEPPEGD